MFNLEPISEKGETLPFDWLFWAVAVVQILYRDDRLGYRLKYARFSSVWLIGSVVWGCVFLELSVAFSGKV